MTARYSWLARGARRGLRPSDQALPAETEPPIGAHVVTPRRTFAHHGIYVGRGRVVQYGGLIHGLRRGPVEEVSLAQFAQGRSIWIRISKVSWLEPDEVVERARRRLGENRYHVLTNNCEHFCEWCVRGEHRSYQVDDLIERWGRARHGVLKVVARVLMVHCELAARGLKAGAGAEQNPHSA